MSLRSFFRKRWVRISLVLLLLLVLGVAGFLLYQLSTTTPAMYEPLGVAQPALASSLADRAETLVYTSLRPGNWDVYLFDGVDAVPRRLTDHPNLDYNAVLSRDGRWVVFASERDGNANLYALDLTTVSDPIALTSHPGMDDAPTLSPDGTWLAFVSTRGGNPDVFVMPFAPGDMDAEARAKNLTNDPYGDFNPTFSPDGSRLAFSSNRAIFRQWNPLRLVPFAQAMTDIYVVDVDGSNLRRVVSALGISGSPAWTEAGDALLYYRATDASESGIYRTEVRGGNTVRLSPDTLAALTPTAGPDGSVIFIGLDQSAPPEGQPALERHGGRLYRMAADGANLTAISSGNRMYLAPYYDAGTGRLVCHGDGPVEERLRMANGTPFTWPGATQTVRLAERSVRLHALRGYFPSITASANRAVAVQWVHEYKGDPPGPSAIVSARLDGRAMQSIYPPPDSGFMWTPVVTRDGAWVFFSKGPRFAAVDDDVDIWKVRTDGTDAVNLTADSDANDAFPDVSADGQWVVFRSGRDGKPGGGRDGNKEIYVMDKDGNQVRRVTHVEGIDTMPAISPDGTWVVYATDRTGKGMKLWIQPLDDSHDEGRLLEPERAHITGLDMHPRFSPDGKWVVFTSDRAGYMDEWSLSGQFPQPYGELFAVPVDGGGPAHRLTHDKWEDALPFWGGSPLSESLVYESDN